MAIELDRMTVDMVLEEMASAEADFIKMGASWQEYYDEVVVSPNDWDLITDEYMDKHSSVNFYNAKSYKDGIPLKKINDWPRSFDVHKIAWRDIKTKNSIRTVIFNSNGEIFLKKDGRKNLGRNINYDFN